MKNLLSGFSRRLLTLLNKALPKMDKVIVQGFPNIEASAVEVYNYLRCNKKIRVFYVVDPTLEPLDKEFLKGEPFFLKKSSPSFFYHYFTAKYIFFTHGSILNSFSAKQVVVNIWHGMCLKPVGRLIGNKAIPATFTVATSEFTRPMFMKSFGVEYNNVIGSGYPRNDALFRAKRDKVKGLQTLNFEDYNKILIWLPTYRKSVFGDVREDGRELGNPFYLTNFDIEAFNRYLVNHSILCLVKPHPMAPAFPAISSYSNIKFINDAWLAKKHMTLYDLAGLTDILISDVSSIVADYVLMDNPIVCISEDIEEYRHTRGFYFDDIENWIPSKICRNAREFLDHLDHIITTGVDPYQEKRLGLKKYFFDNTEGTSTRELVETIFSSQR